MITGRRCLVSGGGGSIGSELVRQLAPTNTIHILDIDETSAFDLCEQQRFAGHEVSISIGDIRDRRIVDDVMYEFKPDIVFHAAARKHVTPSEQNPREAVEVNVIGTCNVVEAAQDNKVENLIFISTDKAVNATSIMGTTKRLGEIIVRNANYTSVRFGNVLGSRGSVIPIWQKQMDEGIPLTITDPNMERFFMTIEQAVNLVIQAAEIGTGGEIIVLDMGKRLKIIDIANQVVAAAGATSTIRIVGSRPGEALREQLMTAEEEARAVKQGNFYIIR